ncbi:MAG: hypothetical protein EPN86_02050 [Nanoarchaeota archaeon]|nr:MAG: hypothetical protein EPN86_02050 [Nanoarchaeota archaeon]
MGFFGSTDVVSMLRNSNAAMQGAKERLICLQQEGLDEYVWGVSGINENNLPARRYSWMRFFEGLPMMSVDYKLPGETPEGYITRMARDGTAARIADILCLIKGNVALQFKIQNENVDNTERWHSTLDSSSAMGFGYSLIEPVSGIVPVRTHIMEMAYLRFYEGREYSWMKRGGPIIKDPVEIIFANPVT